ncbi:MAG: hypothetical protein N3F03_05340 [Ignavibacteria bacterium]|nr:hypothetical protein [Ignavibacteria bacterium]
MKQVISILMVVFFLTTIVFAQSQDKQQVKKDVKVEKTEKKDACCSTEKSSDKTLKKSTCDTDKSKVKSEEECCSDDKAKADDDCCKSDKSSTKVKEIKN